MKRIILMSVLISCLMLNGCCALAGFGMKNAQEENKKKNDAFHKKVCEAMDRAN